VKIWNDDGISRGTPPKPKPVKEAKLDPGSQAPSPVKSGGDRVEVSDRARALLVASDSLGKTPEIRQDRVESLKHLVKDGKYQVRGEKVAERMLGEGLFA
jgi:negative regulator of flagellin synthesis FlgM